MAQNFQAIQQLLSLLMAVVSHLGNIVCIKRDVKQGLQIGRTTGPAPGTSSINSSCSTSMNKPNYSGLSSLPCLIGAQIRVKQLPHLTPNADLLLYLVI
jgi:hypothetical protein